MAQLETYKSIRKPSIPQGRIERPVKGGGYSRREKHKKNYETE